MLLFCHLVTKSCPTLCDPMNCGPPGSSVHGIFQARKPEWVAIPFSRGSCGPQGSNLHLLHRQAGSLTLSTFQLMTNLIPLYNETVGNIYTPDIQFSHLVMSEFVWPHGLQHARLPCPSPTPRTCGNSCPLSQWCHPAISSSVVPFSSCLQSFPASRSFPMS